MQTQLSEIENIIGYTFKNKSLLETAFTHSSYSNEHVAESNEKLEFLGDSVLNFVVAELLYLTSIEDEGAMTVSRASVVSREPLAAAVEKLGLMKYLRTGVGVQKTTNLSTKFQSNIFEAVLGAVYLDGGMESAKHFVYSHLGKEIAFGKANDYKSKLQEYKQAYFNDRELVYKTTETEDKKFVSEVYIGDELLGRGDGNKKKLAERAAAEAALKKLKIY